MPSPIVLSVARPESRILHAHRTAYSQRKFGVRHTRRGNARRVQMRASTDRANRAFRHSGNRDNLGD